MDIQLKQNEIEAAVRRYVSDTIGVNLAGKRLGIQFSATRGASGLVANLSIEDASDIQIPGYTDRNADPVVDKSAGEQTKATVHTLPAATASNTIGAVIAGTGTATEAVITAQAVVEEPAAEVVVAVVEEPAGEIVEGAAPVKEASGLFDND